MSTSIENLDSTSHDDIENFYTDYVLFARQLVERVRRRKGGEPMTVRDYNKADLINLTMTEGLDDFVSIYRPGPVVLDIGAGLGGNCRRLYNHGLQPIGIEYLQALVDYGNEISRDMGLPEFLRQGDACASMGIENADSAIAYAVYNQFPKDQKVAMLRETLNCLKPGGLLWLEDPCYERPLEEWHPENLEIMGWNKHMYNTPMWHDLQPQLEEAGFEIIECTNTTQLWAETCWNICEDQFIDMYLEDKDSLSAREIMWDEGRLLNKARFYKDLSHMTIEQIQTRYPKMCTLIDAQHH